MRIQIFSDLHTDVASIKAITVRQDVDVVCVAGDVAQGADNAFEVLRRIVPASVPILFVMGNHEFYGRFHGEELAAARALAPSYAITLVENDVTVIGNNVRFCGGTMWTNFRLFGDHNAAAAMNASRYGMNDHRRIGWSKQPWERFRPQEALVLHEQTRRFVADVLATPHHGPTVVLTHHAPHYRSVPERYASDILSAAFASDLSDMMSASAGSAPDLRDSSRADRIWIHGHIHSSSDYVVGTTRVIANPHGYGGENPAFDPCLVVELGS
jgi:Icc-related predicted phosphoesterase